jgi:hypothetical protein
MSCLVASRSDCGFWGVTQNAHPHNLDENAEWPQWNQGQGADFNQPEPEGIEEEMQVASDDSIIQGESSSNTSFLQQGNAQTIQMRNDLELVSQNQPNIQLDWMGSFNTEALRKILAAAFPRAQPNSWWLSGSSSNLDNSSAGLG